MLASLDLAELLEETERLAELILCSEEMNRYRLWQQRLKQDEEAQRLIRLFHQKKEEFEEVERFGRYHPDYKRVREEMRRLKRQLDLNESVANFKQAERRLELILYEVSQKIAYAVSETIKVSTGNLYFDHKGCGGCGGGCGHCGNH